MTSTDTFALKHSDLNTFLYADVGTELNGSALTMLSVLARLGQDPWAEAARWTTLPKAAAMDCLVRSIGEMPLEPRDVAETDATASRLFALLPVQVKSPGQTIRAAVQASAVPIWVPVAFFCASILIGLAASMTAAPVTPAGAAVPIAGSTDPPSTIAPK